MTDPRRVRPQRVKTKSGRLPLRPQPVSYRVKDEVEFHRAARHIVMPEMDRLVKAVRAASPDEATRLVQQAFAPSRDRGAFIDGVVRTRASRMREYTGRRWNSVMRGTLSADRLKAGEAAVGRAVGSWEVRERSRLSLAVGDTRRRIQGLAVTDDKEKLVKALEKERGIADRRIRTETRQGVQHLNSDMNRERMDGAGIKTYIWRSRRDERVRPDHQRLEGTVRNWNQSPRPGEPPNCRCVPIANIKPVVD